MKAGENLIKVPMNDILRPDKVHEVTADEEYYFTWDSPGEIVAGVFTARTRDPILIMHVKKVSGVFEYEAAKDTWDNRTTATYVPWSKRNSIL